MLAARPHHLELGSRILATGTKDEANDSGDNESNRARCYNRDLPPSVKISEEEIACDLEQEDREGCPDQDG
jgi:hypothetical protein